MKRDHVPRCDKHVHDTYIVHDMYIVHDKCMTDVECIISWLHVCTRTNRQKPLIELNSLVIIQQLHVVWKYSKPSMHSEIRTQCVWYSLSTRTLFEVPNITTSLHVQRIIFIGKLVSIVWRFNYNQRLLFMNILSFLQFTNSQVHYK